MIKNDKNWDEFGTLLDSGQVALSVTHREENKKVKLIDIWYDLNDI